MARAYQQPQPTDYEPDRGPAEWQSLRSELVALLDQVDGQVARSRDPSLSERVRDLRHQVTEADHETSLRHRDALRSVQRQITRFEEPQPMPPNPRDSLQAAIAQIRSSQGQGQARQQTYSPPPQPAPQSRVQDLAVIERLANSVTGLSGRLERLEGEIKSQIKTGANVKDVADQVAQLAHVVELLAGAVGETGQVKRLEGQIASLGKIMSQGREMDLSTLTRRLDDVAGTVGRLAELQVHFTEKVQNPVELDAFKDGMRSIEDSVRAVYDRIDALERHETLTPADLDVVTREMARFTAAMQDSAQQPQNLVQLIDELNQRISEIESGDRLMHSLRKDLGALRDAVIVLIAPRFDSIDQRLETLSSEVGTRADMAEIGRQIGMLSDRIGERPIDPGISQLEAQVRHLVARMDQTGEQLSGLAKLYAEPAPINMPEIDYDSMASMVASLTAEAMSRNPQPTYQLPEIDVEAVASRVAMRTAEAWQRWTPPAAATAVSDTLADTIGGLEQRITAMLQGMRHDPEINDFGGMQAGINEVNDRLKRLEASLMDRSIGAPQSEAVRTSDIAAIIAEADAQLAPPPRPRDVMPRSPADEAPLAAEPFPEPTGSFDSRPLARNRHPGLGEDVPLAARHEEKPAAPSPAAGFEPPPAPLPSLAFLDATPATAPAVEAKVEAPAESSVSASSRNTFIEAARRAAQRQGTPQAASGPAPASQSNSLIGRALSRFQTTGDKPKVEKPKAEKPIKAKSEKASRALAGDKPARTEFAPEPVVPVAIPEPVAIAETPAAKVKAKGQPMLSPRARMIVLAVGFVIVGSMVAKFAIDYLLASNPEPAATAPITTGEIESLPGEALTTDSLETANAAPVAAGPRVIDTNGRDQITTGAIDKSAAQGFTTSPLQAMPSAFEAATNLANANVAPLTTQSPVKVELPPEAIGPMELREAAANGDVRAQFEVAAILTEGRAVPQDYAAAAIWYERAAAAGFAPAQYRLGSLYENGNGVEKSLENAKLWYERAAEAGNRMSMHNLAAIYAGGGLGKQEFDSAAKWFEEAANRGMTDSQFNLGMLYARGLGVPQSLEESFKWFGIAARSGDADATKARDDIARSLDAETMTRLTDVVNNFTPAPINLAANFAPIGTWSSKFDPGETIAARDIVASVQKALNKLGYDVGTPDGIAGSKTATAIKAFELATGMSEVGLINPRLLAVLGSQPV